MLERLLSFGRRVIPRPTLNFFRPAYHFILAWAAALFYRFPSRGLKVIGVTGTKGKSTVVYLISKIFEEAGVAVAAVGSLGYKIKEKEWANPTPNTMPGRFELQKFLSLAKKSGVSHVVLEITSEGILQNRHCGIAFDAAVFTNLEPEHIERHGSFENYYRAKQKLFKKTGNIHIINFDAKHKELFANFPAAKKVFYGIKGGEIKAKEIIYNPLLSFKLDDVRFQSRLIGEFNLYNILAAISVAKVYNLGLETIKNSLAKISFIAGRAEEIKCGKCPHNFRVFVDYAHTAGALTAVYEAMKMLRPNKLICVLGAAGGGRDKWKRPKLGKMASKYCSEIILSNEDPYDEDPLQILSEIKSGISNLQFPISKIHEIIDRGEAIRKALSLAQKNDIVIITGKGAEQAIRIANEQKIPWDDRVAVKNYLANLKPNGRT